MAAALWVSHAKAPQEAVAPPHPDHHIVSWQLDSFTSESWCDDEKYHAGRHAAGSWSVIPAGGTPRSIMSGAYRLLHAYVPTTLIDDIPASDARLSGLDLRCTSDPEMGRLGRVLLAELIEQPPWSRLRVDLLGQEILLHLLRKAKGRSVAGVPASADGAADWRVRRAVEYLEARLAEDVGLREVAAIVGLTATHLTTLFNSATRESPHRWLMRRRFERACELLDDSPRTITEVAHLCGFASSQHLATVFRIRLLLLRHKLVGILRVWQQGHRARLFANAVVRWRRIVAIEFGVCRSGRIGGAAGSVTFGKVSGP